MSLLLRRRNHHRKVYCMVLKWWHRWYNDFRWKVKGLHHCWSPDQSCGSSQWSPVDTSPLLPCPSTAWFSLLSDQCRQRVILLPTTSAYQSTERYRIMICAKNGRIGGAHQPFPTSQTCWTVGRCVYVYVRKCVSAWCNRRAREIGFMPGCCWWTLNSIAQRHILSNRTLHNVTLSRGASSAFIIR